MKLFPAVALAFYLAAPMPAQTPKTDPLGRDNPRSAVTGFLEACGDRDYQRASEYLDLSAIAGHDRAQRSAELARQLEGILNSDSRFSVLRLSRDAQGDRTDDADPDREHIASISLSGSLASSAVTLDMERTTLTPGGPPVWLFSRDTVAAIPKLAGSSTPPAIARYLPPFFSSVRIAETALWKWLALILAALLLLALSRQADRLLAVVTRVAGARMHAATYVPWFQAIVEPVRLMLSLMVFRLALEVVGPAAIARLYIGRAAQALLVCSIAWCLIRLVDLFLSRVETKLDTRRRFASRSMLHLGRRTANATIVVLGILLILSNWGYNTATLVAGFGRGRHCRCSRRATDDR